MHHTIYHKQPFVRIVVFYVLGILSQSYFKVYSPQVLLFLLGVVGIYLFLSLLKKSYSNFPLSGLFIGIIFFLLGMYISGTQNRSSIINHKEHDVYVARLLEVPKHKNGYYQSQLEVQAALSNNIWVDSKFRIMANFEPDSNINNLLAGQLLLFSAELKNISEKKNPFDFDYKHYLQLKNIEQSVFLKSNDWEMLNSQATGIKQLALNLRQKIIDIFIKSGIEGEQLAVYSALTLGYKDMLDAKVKKAYSGAGAMHVLAVSGLHVGIVLYILKFIFGFLGFKKRNGLKFLLIILGIWVYAFLTGLSVSVLRSSIMFSFLLFGRLINKRLNIYNSLAASALLLLIINPNFLFEVGFQLSYIAVAGIVFFQPRIEKLIYFKNWFLKNAWALTAVSLAAQISTFPITTYYFHQFPSYFWLSNIIVIFAAMAFLVSSFILVTVCWFNFLFEKLGWLINESIMLLNKFVFWINDLPYAIVNGIGLSTYQVYFIYLIIILITAWVITKKYKLLIYGLFAGLMLLGINAIHIINNHKSNLVCIYQIPNASAIHIITGNESNWLVNNKLNIDKDFFDKANIFWNARKVNAVETIKYDSIMYSNEFFVKQNFVGLLNYKGLILNEQINKHQLNSSDSIKLDFILVSGNTNIKLNDLPQNLTYKTIVIDGSVPPWNLKEWKKLENVCIHQTKQDGAYVLIDNQ